MHAITLAVTGPRSHLDRNTLAVINSLPSPLPIPCHRITKHPIQSCGSMPYKHHNSLLENTKIIMHDYYW